ncbi:MAG: methylated-DNA--[protein]-cysteine S-methyltransferase [Armatimonadetes bacterium]|nr:methylated-DNA--[protein]-cysteine S-methyltransferase [Armatimonadota bacterium]
MSLVATSEGLVRVLLGTRLAEEKGPGGACEVADKAAEEVKQYFAGQLRHFTVPVQLEGLTDFQRAVLRACEAIPYGVLVSYGALASKVAGSSRAARAVGQALRANPVPVFIPCHRVVRSDGRLGGFGAGLEWKVWLLALEGIPAEGRAVI